MNFAESEIERKAAENARKLINRAARNEPQITADLQAVAWEVSAEIVGLEHRFKSAQSLIEKIIYQAEKYVQFRLRKEISERKAIEEIFSNVIKQPNDVLRYTYIFPFEKYIFGFEQTLEKLKQQSYKIPENKILNAWKNIGTDFDKGYRGINSVIISSRNQKFELQFHTAESFLLKTKTHKIYKEARLKKTSRTRKTEIAKITVNLAKNIKIPKGIIKL